MTMFDDWRPLWARVLMPVRDIPAARRDALDPGFPELIAKIVAEKSPIDTLVYCAGIGETFETSGVDRDGDTIRVNLAALADAVRAVLPGHAGAGEWPNYRDL